MLDGFIYLSLTFSTIYQTMAKEGVSATNMEKIHALITGPPGIGKTTLVRSVCQQLREEMTSLRLHGFYTEEVRGGGAGRSGRGTRVGFDVVTLDGQRGTLARIDRLAEDGARVRRPTVGRYSVHLESFEELALPALSQKIKIGEGPHLFVVDEIGKMELFSRSFVESVKSLFHFPGEGCIVMATIPVAQQKSHWFVEELRKRKDCLLFEISESNRDAFVLEVTEFLKARLSLSLPTLAS